jgi:hypothetical protein
VVDHQVAGGVAEQDLVGLGRAAQPGDPVDGAAEVVAVALQRLTGVQAMRNRIGVGAGQRSARIVRWISSAAAAASVARWNTEKVASPSPRCLTR